MCQKTVLNAIIHIPLTFDVYFYFHWLEIDLQRMEILFGKLNDLRRLLSVVYFRLCELQDSQDKKKDILFQTSSENYRSAADHQPLILIRTTPSDCNVQSIWCSSLSPGTRIRSIQYWDCRIAVRDCYS